MTKFLFGLIAALVLGLVAAVLWGKSNDDKAERAEFVADSLRDIARSDSVELATLRERTKQVTDSLQRERETALASADSAREAAGRFRGRADSLTRELRARVPETLRPALDSVINEYEATLDQMELESFNLRRSVGLVEAELAAERALSARKDTTIMRLRNALDAQKAATRAWKRAARPPLGLEILRGIPAATACVGAGLISKEPLAGVACGAGYVGSRWISR